MRMSEEGRTRFLVVVIAAILVVTVVVAGLQREEESELPEFEVRRGKNETSIEYVEAGKPSVDYNRSIMANTTIDEETVLEFEVVISATMYGDVYHWTMLSLSVESNLPEELNPEKLRFEAYEDNDISKNIIFWRESSMIDNGSVREDVYLGYREIFDIHSNEFKAESEVVWKIPERNWGAPFTLNLEAAIEGLSEEVSSSIDVHIEGEE